MVSKEFKMKRVYTVNHSYKLNGCEEIKFIGVFSSEKKAKKAVKKLKKQKGFKKYKKGFNIGPCLVNQIYWDGGFFS